MAERAGSAPAPEPVIETERLIIRPWRRSDRTAYAAACNTPNVTAYLGGPGSAPEIDEAIGRITYSQLAHGFSFWAVERRSDGRFLGYCGLKRLARHAAEMGGEVEIGWRLREDAWGQGFASEAAEACLDWAWEHLDIPRVVAMTVPANRSSWRVMERIGMTRRPALDFHHPEFARGHPLSRHLVYTIDRPRAA